MVILKWISKNSLVIPIRASQYQMIRHQARKSTRFHHPLKRKQQSRMFRKQKRLVKFRDSTLKKKSLQGLDKTVMIKIIRQNRRTCSGMTMLVDDTSKTTMQMRIQIKISTMTTFLKKVMIMSTQTTQRQIKRITSNKSTNLMKVRVIKKCWANDSHQSLLKHIITRRWTTK